MLRPSTERGMPALGCAASGQGSGGAHAFDGVEHGDRPDAAVDAGHVDVPLRQPGGKGFGVGTVEAVAVFIDRDLRDDGNIRIDIAAGEHGLMQLFEVAKGFEHQQIDAALDQRRNLLAKGSAGLFETKFCRAVRCECQAVRSSPRPRHRSSWRPRVRRARRPD